MTDFLKNFEKIKGIVSDIYEDFDILESVIKSRAVAFGLDIRSDDRKEDNEEKVIVVYDISIVKLGLLEVGSSLTCFGNYSGKMSAIDSKGNVMEGKAFLCRGVMGKSDISEEQLIKQGAIRWK